MDTTKEIFKEIPDTKTPEVDLLKENIKVLSFERKKETPVTEKEIKKSLNETQFLDHVDLQSQTNDYSLYQLIKSSSQKKILKLLKMSLRL